MAPFTDLGTDATRDSVFRSGEIGNPSRSRVRCARSCAFVRTIAKPGHGVMDVPDSVSNRRRFERFLSTASSAVALRGDSAFQRRTDLDRRWTFFKSLGNTLLLAAILWPIALRRQDVIIASVPVLAATWYLLRTRRWMRGAVDSRRRKLAVAALEFGAFSALVVYLASAYGIVRGDLLILYVWPLYSLSEAEGAVVGSGALAAVLASFVGIALVSGPTRQTWTDVAASALLIVIVLATLLYLAIRGRLSAEQMKSLAQEAPMLHAPPQALAILSNLALRQVPSCDATVMFSVSRRTKIAADPAASARVVATTQDAVDVVTEPSSGHAPARVLEMYFSDPWRGSRQSGKRTMVWHPRGSRGEAQTIVCTLVAPRARGGREVFALLYFVYQHHRVISVDERDSFDLLADHLAGELALYHLRSERRRSIEREVKEQVLDDLHDMVRTNLTGAMTALTAALGTDEMSAAGRTRLVERARSLVQTASASLSFVATTQDIRAVPLASLRSRLESFLSHLPVAANVVLWSEADEDRGELPLPVVVDCYYILQEALMNAIMHSGAANVQVTTKIDRVTQSRVFMVTDDGRGLPVKTAPGRGMIAMRNRATRISATLSVRPPDGHGGVVVELVIPRTSLYG